MAEADPAPPAAARARGKGGIMRLLLPLLMLVAGLGGGYAAALFLPPILPDAAAPRPPQPKVVPLAYVEIDNSFTANLTDTGRFIQVRIAVSTNGGPPVEQAIARHKVAIVAAVLDVLASTSEASLHAEGGRARLTAAMRRAINEVLQRKSGLAGVDDVFLTSFVLQ